MLWMGKLTVDTWNPATLSHVQVSCRKRQKMVFKMARTCDIIVLQETHCDLNEMCALCPEHDPPLECFVDL